MFSTREMQLLLLICLLGMELLGVFCLRRRQLSVWGYLGWGLLTVLLPLLGPFLVILFRPGKRRIIEEGPGAPLLRVRVFIQFNPEAPPGPGAVFQSWLKAFRR